MNLPKLRKEERWGFSCNQDPNSGIVSCEAHNEFPDGSREHLASEEFQFDDRCVPRLTNVEGRGEEVEKLHKRILPLLKTQCKNIPKDY